MKKLKVTLEDRPVDVELAQYKRMFEAACSSLAAIGDALGVEPEEGGAEPILSAIAELKNSPVQQAEQEPVGEALQIASVALQDIACSSQTENLYWWQLRARKAQKQIAECLTNAAPVKPVKQEPFMCEPVPPISEDGWTDWVCPKPQGYLMQCCDCGLIHEVDSRVAMYQPMPSEEFEVVENPNMQCQWRVRRRDDLRESNVKV